MSLHCSLHCSLCSGPECVGINLGKVVIEVYGGVAEVTQNPDGVDVEIIDHDNEQNG